MLQCLLIAVAMLPLMTINAEREHKVHNIVLYPERHSWCQTTPIKQVVAMPGFKPATIANNVCVGACYSYSIPRTQPAEPGELIGPYCDSCQPVDTQCYHVTLNRANGETIQKRVQIITNCSCLSCSKVENRHCEILDENTPELPQHMFSDLHPNNTSQDGEVPELFLHQFPHNRTTTRTFTGHEDTSSQNNVYKSTPVAAAQPKDTIESRVNFNLNTKLVKLLKSIQGQAEGGDDASNFSYNREELDELLAIIEGSERELSDKNLLNFVNIVNGQNAEDLELDLSKLKEVLMRKKLLEKHRQYGLGPLDNHMESTVAAADGGIFKKGGGATFNKLSPDSESSGNAIAVHSKDVLHHSGKGGGHHNHVVGESETVAGSHGHLIQGPHGSLVFAPDMKVEEKLSIDSDQLKPIHEDVIVSYENHPGHNVNQRRKK